MSIFSLHTKIYSKPKDEIDYDPNKISSITSTSSSLILSTTTTNVSSISSTSQPLLSISFSTTEINHTEPSRPVTLSTTTAVTLKQNINHNTKPSLNQNTNHNAKSSLNQNTNHNTKPSLKLVPTLSSSENEDNANIIEESEEFELDAINTTTTSSDSRKRKQYIHDNDESQKRSKRFKRNGIKKPQPIFKVEGHCPEHILYTRCAPKILTCDGCEKDIKKNELSYYCPEIVECTFDLHLKCGLNRGQYLPIE